MGHQLSRRPAQGRAARLRHPGGAAVLRVRPGQGRPDGARRAAVRGAVRSRAPTCRSGTARSRLTTCLRRRRRLLGRIFLDMHPRADKYNHAAMFAMTVGKAGVRSARMRAGLQLPAARGRAGADAALRRHDVLPRVRPPDPPRLRRPPPLGRHLRHRHRVGLRRGAVAAARGVDRRRRTRSPRSPSTTRPASRCRPRWWRSSAPPTSSARACSCVSRCSTPRSASSSTARDPDGIDLVAVEPTAHGAAHPVPARRRHLPAPVFGHLDGYSALYYTYMWSLVIAKDLFTVFAREGLLDPAPAARYRHRARPGRLGAGGRAGADFLGRPYAFDAYQAWLDGD